MGRETQCHISFQGQEGQGKILLESQELILRGDIRARIIRSLINTMACDGDDLVVITAQGPIRATMGAAEAARWVKAFAKPLPSLAEKLGLGPDRPARVLGPLTDPELIAALTGCLSPTSLLILAELPDQAAMDNALAQLRQTPHATFWGVTVKGAKVGFSDAALRARMRAAGYIDTKSCAVSDRHSATRYSPRS